MQSHRLSIRLNKQPSVLTLRQLFQHFPLLNILWNQTKLYAEFAHTHSLQEFIQMVKERTFVEFDCNSLLIWNNYQQWKVEVEDCPFQVTSENINATSFQWKSLESTHHSHQKTSKTDNYEMLEQSVYDAQKIDKQSQIISAFVTEQVKLQQPSGSDNFGLFEVGLCEQTTVIELDFGGEADNKNQYVVSNEQKHLENAQFNQYQQQKNVSQPISTQGKIEQKYNLIQRSSYQGLIEEQQKVSDSLIVENQTSNNQLDQEIQITQQKTELIQHIEEVEQVQKPVRVEIAIQPQLRQPSSMAIFVIIVLILWIIFLACL